MLLRHFARRLVLSLMLVSWMAADANLGLVARYRFETLIDGCLKDDSGKGNDLYAQGTVRLAPGKVGQAVVVSRAGYPQAPRAESLELGGAMTLEAWIKPSRAVDMRIFDRQTIGGSDGFLFDTHPNGHLRLIIAPGMLRDLEPLPIGEWSHVAATYCEESGEARLYRNGRVVAEGFFAGKLRPSIHPLNLGANQDGGDRFDGLLDEVRIYCRCWPRKKSWPISRAKRSRRRRAPPRASSRCPCACVATRPRSTTRPSAPGTTWSTSGLQSIHSRPCTWATATWASACGMKRA